MSSITLAFSNQQGKSSIVKNLIIMIPDGTSSELLALSRWYQTYYENRPITLAVDPYICGLVKSHCSNSIIGESAATTSTYMTGQLMQASNISTYPLASSQDLIPIDASRSYQPLITLMEASRIKQNKATGMVFTCYYPHATPADCSSHYYDRGASEIIAKQIAYNQFDVIIGGGTDYMKPTEKKHLISRGYSMVSTKEALDTLSTARYWALLSDQELPLDMKRDPKQIPSLAEMTQKAITALNQNPNGFMLMVEGSQIDWQAHGNKAKGVITEYIAFDRAVEAAIDFAKRDGNTAVVVVPDHATGGVSLGSRASDKLYAQLGLKRFVESLDEDKDACMVGFTSGGHTGEDVFLAVYHPSDIKPSGVISNVDLHRYMCQISGLENTLDSLTHSHFSPHQQLLTGLNYQINNQDPLSPTLTIKKKSKTIVIKGFTNLVTINGKQMELESITLYMEKNKTFYIPRSILQFIQ